LHIVYVISGKYLVAAFRLNYLTVIVTANWFFAVVRINPITNWQAQKSMGLLKFKQTIFSKTHFTGGRVARYRNCPPLCNDTFANWYTRISYSNTVNICYSSGGWISDTRRVLFMLPPVDTSDSNRQFAFEARKSAAQIWLPLFNQSF
jgi:hypothetical protein